MSIRMIRHSSTGNGYIFRAKRPMCSHSGSIDWLVRYMYVTANADVRIV